jgi:hypothetical protein
MSRVEGQATDVLAGTGTSQIVHGCAIGSAMPAQCWELSPDPVRDCRDHALEDVRTEPRCSVVWVGFSVIAEFFVKSFRGALDVVIEDLADVRVIAMELIQELGDR